MKSQSTKEEAGSKRSDRDARRLRPSQPGGPSGGDDKEGEPANVIGNDEGNPVERREGVDEFGIDIACWLQVLMQQPEMRGWVLSEILELGLAPTTPGGRSATGAAFGGLGGVVRIKPELKLGVRERKARLASLTALAGVSGFPVNLDKETTNVSIEFLGIRPSVHIRR